MEFVVFAGVLLFLFLFMIVQELMQAKKEEKMFRKSLLENYGKEPPKEYSAGEICKAWQLSGTP